MAYSSPFKFRLSPYQTDNLLLRTVSQHALCVAHLSILAFDTVDAEHMAQRTIFMIADFLSANCSIPVHVGARVYEETEHMSTLDDYTKINISEASDIGSRPRISVSDLTDITIKGSINKFYDESWLDEYPLYANCLQLPISALPGIKWILSGVYRPQFSRYLNATRLYNTACKYEALHYGKKGYYGFDIIGLDLSPVEIANTLFMSSFETLASVFDNNVQTCNACGQPKFRLDRKL